MTAFTPESQENLKALLAEMFGKGSVGNVDDIDPTVSLELFDDDARVAEVGAFYSTGERTGAGFSFMRSDPEALGVILACEDVMLAHGTEHDWRDGEPDADYENEARWRLAFLLAPDDDARSDFAAAFQLERIAS